MTVSSNAEGGPAAATIPATSPTANPAGAVGSARFWEDVHAAGQSGWNLGTPTPALVGLLASPDAPKPGPTGRALVPGCGFGHDVLRLARAGFRAVGVDFAAYAVDQGNARAAAAGLPAEFLRADLFELPRLRPDWVGGFDLVFEYTCFCAIDPARRADYAEVVSRMLRPGGELVALFFPLRSSADFPGGPPFAVSEAEIRTLFGPAFEFRSWTPQPPLSVPLRRRFEALARLVRK
jgi:SAM-dependent methyltransferase